MVRAVPEGFNTASADLVVQDAEEAMEFYRKGCGAETRAHMPDAFFAAMAGGRQA